MDGLDIAASVCARLGRLNSTPVNMRKFEKYLLFLIGVLCVFSVFFAVSYSVTKDIIYIKFVNYFLIFLLFAILLLISSGLISAIIEMRNPGSLAFSVVSNQLIEELNLVEKFRGVSVKELELIKDRNVIGIVHMRNRFSLMIGAIDRVGVFPTTIALFVSNYRIFTDIKLDSFDNYLMWATVFMSVMYSFSFYVIYAVHQMERLNFTIDLAIARHPEQVSRAQFGKG